MCNKRSHVTIYIEYRRWSSSSSSNNSNNSSNSSSEREGEGRRVKCLCIHANSPVTRLGGVGVALCCVVVTSITVSTPCVVVCGRNNTITTT